MRKDWVLVVVGCVCLTAVCGAQIKRTAVPLGNAVGEALKKGSLTGEGARPFHIRVIVSEPENSQSPYQGTIEEWWTSQDQWRLEVTAKGGMRQTVVMAGGKKSEKDEGEYFPLWLRRFLNAVNDPIPNAGGWATSGGEIEQITMPDGAKSDACARAQSKIGTGERATDAFSNVCFDGEGRLKFYGSPSFSMEFHDYKGFGKKQIARMYVDNPEPGTGLVGKVEVLEELKGPPDALFAPLATNDDRFRSVHVNSEQMERMIAGNPPIDWPPVRSGNTKGKLAVYIATDADGNVREAWPLNSDNAGLEDPVRAQVMKWKLKPAVDHDGKKLQVEGGIGFAFGTEIADPIPVLSDAEARQLVTSTVDPKFGSGAARGTRYRVRIAVNEQGKVTGGAAGDTEVPGTVKPTGNDLFAIMMATREWHFKPLIRDGKPQYFFAELVFEVK
jgi:hypothetical protein